MNGQQGNQGGMPPQGMPYQQQGMPPQGMPQQQQGGGQMQPQYGQQPMQQQQYGQQPMQQQGQMPMQGGMQQQQQQPQGGGMLSLNMSDQSAAWADTSGGPPLTPGRYNFECIQGDAGQSQAGNPVAKLRLRVVDGPSQGVEFTHTYTVQTGVHRLIGLMRACWGQERPDFNPMDFVGAKFSAEVKHRSRGEDGNVFMDIRAHEPFGGASPNLGGQQSMQQQGGMQQQPMQQNQGMQGPSQAQMQQQPQQQQPQQQQPQQQQPQQQQPPTGMWTNMGGQNQGQQG